MNLPKSTNVLGYQLENFHLSENQDLYKVVHQKSEIEIVEMVGRNWIKMRFLDA